MSPVVTRKRRGDDLTTPAARRTRSSNLSQIARDVLDVGNSEARAAVGRELVLAKDAATLPMSIDSFDFNRLKAATDDLVLADAEHHLAKSILESGSEQTILDTLQTPAEGETLADSYKFVVDHLTHRSDATAEALSMVWRLATAHEPWKTHTDPKQRTLKAFFGSLSNYETVYANLVMGTHGDVRKKEYLSIIRDAWGSNWYSRVPKSIQPSNVEHERQLSPTLLREISKLCVNSTTLEQAISQWTESIRVRTDEGLRRSLKLGGKPTRPHLFPCDIIGVQHMAKVMPDNKSDQNQPNPQKKPLLRNGLGRSAKNSGINPAPKPKPANGGSSDKPTKKVTKKKTPKKQPVNKKQQTPEPPKDTTPAPDVDNDNDEDEEVEEGDNQQESCQGHERMKELRAFMKKFMLDIEKDCCQECGQIQIKQCVKFEETLVKNHRRLHKEPQTSSQTTPQEDESREAEEESNEVDESQEDDNGEEQTPEDTDKDDEGDEEEYSEVDEAALSATERAVKDGNNKDVTDQTEEEEAVVSDAENEERIPATEPETPPVQSSCFV